MRSIKRAKPFVITIAVLFVIELAVAMALPTPLGTTAFYKLPAGIQETYINYILKPSFGYFRNCARKSTVFQLLDKIDGERYSYQFLSFNRRLLFPYVRDGSPIFQNRECPLLMEPAPVIAIRELYRNDDMLLILDAINHHSDHLPTVKRICRRVPADKSMTPDTWAIFSKACGAHDNL